MKFIDTFNEDDKKKLIKKGKLIYSVLKKGTITRSDGVSFSYELGDDPHVIIDDGEIEIFGFVSKIIENTYCPINHRYMTELIGDKFNKFNINARLSPPNEMGIVKYEGKKPWEESLNEEHLTPQEEENLKKKALTIFKGLRKGVVKISHPRKDEVIKFRYRINDNIDGRWQVYPEKNYWGLFTSNQQGEGMTVHVDNEQVFNLCTQGTESISTNPTGIHLIEMLISNIQKKFDIFDVKIHINKPGIKFVLDEPSNEPLNEDTKVDKERKKVKTIHKAIRRGFVTVEGYRFRYELPEDYTFHMVNDVLTQTSIKFTFYNHDLGQNFGGLGLPLRVWRIEDGKDVFVNGILSKDDVSDIVYGDEYLLNTRSSVDYANVKNKVRNKYRNFDINCIMTTPSDTVMVNESEDKYEEHRKKMIKKGKTIFKAFRKGVMSDDQPDGLRFSYELSDDFTVDINNLGIIIFTAGVKIKELNRACDRYSPAYMVSRIRNKFYQFDVVLTYPQVTSEDVERWEEPEEPINEEKDYNLTDKDKKKAHLIYKTFKTGKYQVDDLTYRYELPDEYWISKDEEGNPVVVLTMHPEQKMKLYATLTFKSGDKHEVPVDKQYKSLYKDAEERIEKKFQQFNVDIIF